MTFASHKLNRRALKLVLLLLLGIPLLTWVALRAYLAVKVRQAEVLLSQVKALRVRESTFQDAKQLADQYNGRVEYQDEPCTFHKCAYTISLGPSWATQPDFISETLRFVGIRPYSIDASVRVGNRRIIEAGFMVDIEARRGAAGGQWLVASADVSEHFRSDYDEGHWRGLDEHPNRQISHPHLSTSGGGQAISSEITPDANATERERAFDFRLSCISSFRGCAELRELVPSAWADLMKPSTEQGRQVEPPRDYGACSTRSLARLARDMDNVLLVEVKKVFPIEKVGDSSLQDVEFHLIEVLKGQTNKHLSLFPLETPAVDAAADNQNPGLPSNMFSPGNQIVLFLTDSEVNLVPYPRCEVAAASHENIAVVRQTVTQLSQGAPITALAEQAQRLP